jgi:hypothetical protein
LQGEGKKEAITQVRTWTVCSLFTYTIASSRPIPHSLEDPNEQRHSRHPAVIPAPCPVEGPGAMGSSEPPEASWRAVLTCLWEDRCGPLSSSVTDDMEAPVVGPCFCQRCSISHDLSTMKKRGWKEGSYCELRALTGWRGNSCLSPPS